MQHYWKGFTVLDFCCAFTSSCDRVLQIFCDSVKKNFPCIYTYTIMLDIFVSTYLRFTIVYKTSLSLTEQYVQLLVIHTEFQKWKNEMKWHEFHYLLVSISLTSTTLWFLCIIYLTARTLFYLQCSVFCLALLAILHAVYERYGCCTIRLSQQLKCLLVMTPKLQYIWYLSLMT